MHQLINEFRYTLRSLLRSKAYTASCVLTLAISLAQVLVVFTVVDRVLLRPLPYADPEQLRIVYERSKAGDLRLASYPMFLDLEAQSRSVAALGYARASGVNITTSDGLLRATIANVSPGYLRLLGARPALGRVFLPDEEQAGRGDVVVLSYAFWRQAFGGDTAIIGRKVTVNQSPVRVVGVLPRGAGYPSWANLWRPIGAIIDTDAALKSRNLHSDGRIIARLQPGVDSTRATMALSVMQARLANAYPEDADWTSVTLLPLKSEVIGEVSPPLRVLAGATLLVWLLMCLNVASLAVARRISRTREMAVRITLGATGVRLAWQAVIEGVLLASSGGVLGLVIAGWVVSLRRSAAVPGLPRTDELAMDARVVTVAVLLAVVTGLISSALPALRMTDLRSADSLRDGRMASTGGRRGSRIRSVLTVSQVALALMLLIGAVLLIETVRRMGRIELGFEPSHVTTFYVFPPSPKYDRPEQAAEVYRRLLEAVSAVPGVESAAVVNTPPLTGRSVVTDVVLPDWKAATEPGRALYVTVSDGYLRTMGMRVVRGRWFTAADMAAPGSGVVINTAMAEHFWPSDDPIGRPVTIYRSSTLRPEYGEPMPSTVIGVVNDVRHFGFTDRFRQQVYVPYTREVWPGIGLMVRTSSEPNAAIPTLRRTVRDVLPDIPINDASGTFGFRPLASFASESLAIQRYLSWLVGVFAASALLLAMIGTYGLMAYLVSQRTPEFGVRMALGATRWHILGTVMSHAAKLAAAGAVVGLVAAFALTRVMRAVLYETSPADPAIFLLSTLILLAVVMTAAFWPALRATNVEPVIAIRAE